MKREELIRSKEFWLIQIQNKVFNLIENFRKEKKLNKTEIAGHLGVTKGYVTQILNGDYDHKVSKLVDLALSFDKAPVLNFIDINKYIQDDRKGKVNFENPIPAPINCVFFSSSSLTMWKLDPKYSDLILSVWDQNASQRTSPNLEPAFEKAATYSNFFDLAKIQMHGE